MTRRDPARWSAIGTAVDPELRAALQSINAAGPSAAEVEAVARRVEQLALGGAESSQLSAADEAQPPVSGSAASTLAKLALVGALVGGLAWYASRAEQPSVTARTDEASATDPTERPVPAATVRGDAASGRAAPEPSVAVDRVVPSPIEPHASSSSEPRAKFEPAVRKPRVRKPTRSVHVVPVQPEAVGLSEVGSAATGLPKQGEWVASEVELLSEAQRLLVTAPERALGAIERHARAFPNGTLAEERDALRIEALIRLERVVDAGKHASRFERAYPRSTHSARIRRLLDRASRARD